MFFLKALVGAFFGLVLAFPIMIFGGGGRTLAERNEFHSTTILACIILGGLIGLLLGLKDDSEMSKLVREDNEASQDPYRYEGGWDRFERLKREQEEAKLREIREESAPLAAYYTQNYLPIYNAWQKDFLDWVKQRDARDAWREKTEKAWEPYEQRAYKAAAAFEAIFREFNRQAHIEHGLSNQTDIIKMFPHALSGNLHLIPDAGLLRLVAREAHPRLPKLLYLRSDARLVACLPVLPPPPPLPNMGPEPECGPQPKLARDIQNLFSFDQHHAWLCERPPVLTPEDMRAWAYDVVDRRKRGPSD